jgi:hypothetical protein
MKVKFSAMKNWKGPYQPFRDLLMSKEKNILDNAGNVVFSCHTVTIDLIW